MVEDGPIPHFHFYAVYGAKKGCIKLDKAQYFTHRNNTGKINLRKGRFGRMA